MFAFGDAVFHGSASKIHLTKPIVGRPPAPRQGVLVGGPDGGIFTFGGVPFEGSLGGHGFNNIIGMAPTTAPLPDFLLVAPASVSVRSGEHTRAATILGAIHGGQIQRYKPAAAAQR